MMELTININKREEILTIQAVRIHPLSQEIKLGTLCTYNLYLESEPLDIRIESPFGDGIKLGKVMLDTYLEIRDELK